MDYTHVLLCVLLHLHLTGMTVCGVAVEEKDFLMITKPDYMTSFGPLGLSISGPDAVTVGVPCSFVCLALCSPECSYTVGVDEHIRDGIEVAFTLKRWVSSKTVTCTGRNNVTGRSSTVRKTLRILEGPVNVSITKQTFTSGHSQRFLCSATCKPSCNYTWMINGDVIAGYGDEVVISPIVEDIVGVLICKATNSMSGLFITATQKINVLGRHNKSMSERPELLLVLFACLMSGFSVVSP
ncbi:uncharacterized protein LOC143514808 [Brachyhypopomus gauderio]|uniref:uncharacterized protein LOC143514808 n=1 Tax=Brachyhypopomus gauderio TaxID=698409 RepID=UPI0040421565